MREHRNNFGNRDAKGRCIVYCILIAMNSLSALSLTAGALMLKKSHNQGAAIALIAIGGSVLLFCNGIPLTQFLCRSRHRINADNEATHRLNANGQHSDNVNLENGSHAGATADLSNA